MILIASKGWFWRLASSAALVFAFLFALDHPLHAQATLIVSYYGFTPNHTGHSGTIFYATNSSYTAGAQIGQALSGSSQEATSCLAGATPELFVSANTAEIDTYNLNSAFNGVTSTTPTKFVDTAKDSLYTGDTAGLSIGPNGWLYAASSGKGIYAFDIATGAQEGFFPLSGAHDVVYAPLARGRLGIVFATADMGSSVYALDPISLTDLGSGYDITLPSGVTFMQEGLAVDSVGDLFVSNFGTVDATQPGVYEYLGATPTVTPIEFINSLFDHPLGLAAGPLGDSHMYVANFGNSTISDFGGVLQIDPSHALTAIPVTLTQTSSPALVNPKYLQFIENCTPPAPVGTVEICKLSSPINPVPPGGVYGFNVTGVANTVTVPVGECSGPISVASPVAVITELPTPGVAVYTITTDGYSPPPLSQQLGNALLESYDLQKQTANVIVQTPTVLGDTSTETLVTFTNYVAPPAQLKVCQIAGTGVTSGTPFPFMVVNVTNAGSGYSPPPAPAPTVNFTGCTTEPTATAVVSNGSVTAITLTSLGSGCPPVPGVTIAPPPSGTPPTATASANFSLEAGPPAQGGYCQVVSGTFEVGTSATIEGKPPLCRTAAMWRRRSR